MRGWIAAAVTAVVGIGVGWLLRGRPEEKIRVVTLPSAPPKAAPPAPSPPAERPFPEHPKPPLEAPQPVVESTPPPPLIGALPKLPGAIGGGVGPLSPLMPPKLPTADLNADEALARRIVLQAGGQIVSASDAKDSTGKVGRMLVAETDREGREALRMALRSALGDRVLLSEGGSVAGTSPEVEKEEKELEAARKKRDQARRDFLPEAPALRQIEEDYRNQERAMTDLRKSTARPRLNILLRPVLTP